MNKKGVFDIFFVLILLFVIAVFGLIVMTFVVKISDVQTSSGIFPNNSLAYSSTEYIKEESVSNGDLFVFLFFIGSVIGLVLGAVKTNFSPILIFLFLLILILSVLVAAGLVNIYHGFATSEATAEVSSQLTLTNIVFSRFTPLIIAIIGALVLIVMYGKSGGDIIQ